VYDSVHCVVWCGVVWRGVVSSALCLIVCVHCVL
jgi:hypothetical protein